MTDEIQQDTYENIAKTGNDKCIASTYTLNKHAKFHFSVLAHLAAGLVSSICPSSTFLPFTPAKKVLPSQFLTDLKFRFLQRLVGSGTESSSSTKFWENPVFDKYLYSFFV